MDPVEVGFLTRRNRQQRRQIGFRQRLHAVADTVVNSKRDDAELFQRFAITVKKINTHWQLGLSVHPNDIAVTGAVTRHNADHFTEPVGNTGAAY